MGVLCSSGKAQRTKSAGEGAPGVDDLKCLVEILNRDDWQDGTKDLPTTQFQNGQYASGAVQLSLCHEGITGHDSANDRRSNVSC